VAPRGSVTRPTSDRVREATFNALGSAAALEGAIVLDLFAGSGALGIEALSRGAARATFVEHDRAALAALGANLRSCGLGGDRAAVVVGDVMAFLRSGALAGPWGLALLDPPYAFGGWSELLGGLEAEVAVCESPAAVVAPEGWRVARTKAYGGTVVTICRRHTEGAER
jgi:16S rRNA (guanine966-N2)-methyltransferase